MPCSTQKKKATSLGSLSHPFVDLVESRQVSPAISRGLFCFFWRLQILAYQGVKALQHFGNYL
jgi:hypothetical protein